MNLAKWEPLKELEDISHRLNRFFSRGLACSEPAHEMLSMTDWTPSTDVSESDTGYLIKAEIPGVKKEDVKVTVQDGMLTISGERRQEKEEKDKKFHRIECSYGSFVRSFRIPDDADELAVKAEFKDGMLNVTLAKSGKAKAHALDVKVS